MTAPTYNVTYRETDTTIKADHIAGQELPIKDTLASIRHNCERLTLNADLFDDAGFHKGYVKAHGDYSPSTYYCVYKLAADGYRQLVCRTCDIAKAFHHAKIAAASGMLAVSVIVEHV
jgi:hypothetical protein